MGVEVWPGGEVVGLEGINGRRRGGGAWAIVIEWWGRGS